MLKAQLELQQNDLELSHVDLQRALFLLESGTGESWLQAGSGAGSRVSPRPCWWSCSQGPPGQ